MRTVTLAGFIVGAAALAAGCSGAAPPLPASVPATRSMGLSVDPAVKMPAGVYVSSENVTFYSVNEAAHSASARCNVPVTFTSGTFNIGIGSNHVLWAPIGFESGDDYTLLFGPDCGQPLQVIPDAHGEPEDVTFDSKGGAYVLNAVGSGALHPNIDAYRAGHLRSPKTTLVERNATVALGEVVDKRGDVFMSYLHSYGTNRYNLRTAEFVGGKNPAVELNLSASNNCIGNVAIDKAQRLLVTQCGSVLVFKRPYRPHDRVASFALVAPGYCKFDKGGVHLYCADSGGGAVDAYKYDAEHPKKSSYAFSWPATEGVIRGLAPDPPFGY